MALGGDLKIIGWVAISLLGVAINSNSLHHLHSPLQHSPPSYLVRVGIPSTGYHRLIYRALEEL
jgi:hypothetical protein